jgi:hypothetical protein
MWEEFQPIELGHWDKKDLRTLSESIGLKGEYDRFYSWTSSYSHGHWGAIRESVFDTCMNPLHRLHRIPRPKAKALPDVVPDACFYVDKILEVLDKLYPHFAGRVTVNL